MKRKKENQDIKNNRSVIERFENSMFQVLATMDQKLLQELINNYGLRACDRDGRNILMNLIIEHGEELCLYLLHEYEVDVNATDFSLFTPLHFAAIEDAPEIAERLIRLGAIVNAQDEDGNTPLFYALRYRVSASMINLLLDHGASQMIENNYGVKPINRLVTKKYNGETYTQI